MQDQFIGRSANILAERRKRKGAPAYGPDFYTVTAIQGDYADLVSDQGQPHSITMFLLPEGTTVGSRLKLENFLWTLEG